LSNSPTGWTNNDLGLAWLEQVFNRSTQQKARRRWRLLILDGHGSHVTMDFIKFCDSNKILLAVSPPHATHTLQPLDVVLFGPLSASYSKELTTYLHNSQGLVGMRKGDFFTLFWAAWMDSFTESRILKSFEATGISPPNAEVILKRFNDTTSEQDRDLENREDDNWSSWRQLRRLFDAAVKDPTTVEVHENEGLRTALSIKKKHNKKSITIAPKEDEEYYGGFMFWSPRKVRVAEARERLRKQQEEEEKIRKAGDKELKAAVALYKKKMAEEAKVSRQLAKEAREKDRKLRADEVAARRAQKQQEKEAEKAAKAIQLSQRDKGAALKPPVARVAKRRTIRRVGGGAIAVEAAPPAPPKTTRTRSIQTPKKYSE
jgi:hypothetical protein